MPQVGTNIVMQTDMREVIDMFNRMRYEKVVKSKDIKKEIRKVLSPVRKSVMNAAKSSLPNDPRKAYQAVKTVTYRDANGGNVSLYNRKNVRSMQLYKKNRGGESGIIRHRKISNDTKRINSYYGRDRAFILRFINDGTDGRIAFTKNKSKNGVTAYRGQIRGKNFFTTTANSAMSQASKTIAVSLERIISETANK